MSDQRQSGFVWYKSLSLWAPLSLAVLFWLMNALDRTWGPNDLWAHLFFAPVKPIELAFRPLGNFLLANKRAWGNEFYAVWFFGMFCYTLAGSLYPTLWGVLRGRCSRWSWVPFLLAWVLFAAQLKLGYGWGSYVERA